MKSSALRLALRKDPTNIRTRRCFVANFPDGSEHHNHMIGPVRCLINFTHRSLGVSFLHVDRLDRDLVSLSIFWAPLYLRSSWSCIYLIFFGRSTGSDFDLLSIFRVAVFVFLHIFIFLLNFLLSSLLYLLMSWALWLTSHCPSVLQVSTSLGNSCLCWTVFARNRDTAVPAEGNGDLQTLICVLVARPRRCLTSSNPVPWQN